MNRFITTMLPMALMTSLGFAFLPFDKAFLFVLGGIFMQLVTVLRHELQK